MRTKTLLQNLFMLLAAAFIVGCDKEPSTTPEPQPKGTISIEVGETSETTIEFAITSANVDEVRYVALESTEPAPTADAVLTSGEAADANTTATATLENLNADTEYTIYVVATQGDTTLEARANAKTAKATEYPAASIDITFVEASTTTATISISSENAEDVRLLIKLASEGDPTEEDWQNRGSYIQPNTTQTIEIAELEPYTEYIVAGVATGLGLGAEKQITIRTTCSPTLNAGLTDQIGPNYVEFAVDYMDVSEIRYVCILADSRDVTAEQVMTNGTIIENNVTRIENLEAETSYEIYVAAKGLDDTLIMADTITFTTTCNVQTYVLSENTTASSYQYSQDNFYITFIDHDNGHIFKADFYTDPTNIFLPSGDYTLGGMSAGELSKSYTTFMVTEYDEVVKKFDSGTLHVVAETTDSSYDVYYTITGTLYLENGDQMDINFSGTIAGISLPEPEEPESDTIEFVPSPETYMPRRYHTASIEPGEYYIKFADKDSNELVVDILLDPESCNDGKDPLPEGSYSIVSQTLTDYSYITLYNPYMSAYFSEAELEVSRSGDDYTFTLIAKIDTDSGEKLVKMNYTGPVNDMIPM